MKASVLIIATVALVVAAASFAGNTIRPPVDPEVASGVLEPDASSSTVRHDSSKDGTSKVRQQRRCAKNDKDCKAGR